ncbi:MAG TPA: alpha/beta fold hydrolase [Leptolyngbyaceae cyanobacterium M65_K2018_010]|nr:alpha/beta fold hydrolase [Leptolyngbyaceae cyanobacterium M65_K2018_010]
MDGTGDLFFTQAPHLKPYFDLRALAIPRTDLSSWPDLAKQVVQLIHHLAGYRPIYLCGESFGACLALQALSLAPDLADYVILINGASSLHRFPWEHWLTQLNPAALGAIVKSFSLGYWPLLADPSRIRPDHYQRLLGAIQSVPPLTMAWRLALLAQFRLEATLLHRLKAPTLLIASLADQLLPSLAEAQYLATHLPNARLYPLPHSGHASLLERQVNLGQILAETHFLPAPGRVPEPPQAVPL